MTVGIVTAIYGDYELLKPLPAQSVAVDAVCVTDDPSMRADGWRIVVEPSDDHPNLAAKRPKMLPWEYVDADESIWIDGAFRVRSHLFAGEAAAMLDQSPVAQFVHPWRDCIYDECRASLALPKYAGLPMSRQVGEYRCEQHPEHWGLWATGCIVRAHTAEVVAFSADWLAECERWTYQDQLSEAPCLRRAGLRPAALPGDHISNPWLFHEPHSAHL